MELLLLKILHYLSPRLVHEKTEALCLGFLQNWVLTTVLVPVIGNGKGPFTSMSSDNRRSLQYRNVHFWKHRF